MLFASELCHSAIKFNDTSLVCLLYIGLNASMNKEFGAQVLNRFKTQANFALLGKILKA